MRVLIVNKFFYPRGGDCVVAMSTRELLMQSGHDVRVYAMTHPDNISLPESDGFATRITFDGGVSAKVGALKRLLGRGDVCDSFRKVIKDFRPDIVHVHNIHSYLSPVLCKIARECGVPVVWTLHDYKLLCPAYSFRKGDGSICDCVEPGRCSIIHDKCLKNSLANSAMAYIESVVWSRKKLGEYTDIFIAPSKFMATMMAKGGYDPGKIEVLYNSIDPVKLELIQQKSPSGENSLPYFAYTGRLSEEKGVATMVKAAMKAGVTLRIAGEGPLRKELEQMASGHDNIIFHGNLPAKEVTSLQSGALACICPSEWFENNPLAVIESLCAGTPVIGASIGGIPELITPGENGRLFSSGDTDALSREMSGFRPEEYDREDISRKAIEKFSRERHLDQLMNIYNKAISKQS